ncbi:MAG: hypothetical protein ABIA92_02740 [Patescibacteria group bacterium]
MSKQKSVDLHKMEIIHDVPRKRKCPKVERRISVKAQLGVDECILGNPHPDCKESRFRAANLLCEHFRHDLTTICLRLREYQSYFIRDLKALLDEGHLTKQQHNIALAWAQNLDLNCKFHCTAGTVDDIRVMVRVKKP